MKTLRMIRHHNTLYATYEFIYESEKETIVIGEVVGRYAERLFKQIMVDLIDLKNIEYIDTLGRRAIPEFLGIYLEDHNINFKIKKLKEDK